MTDQIGSPTGERIVVRAFDVTSSYDLRGVRQFLTQELRGRAVENNPLVYQLSGRRSCVVFEYGSIVFFNFEPLECERIMAQLRPFAQRPNRAVTKDEFTLLLAPKWKKPEGVEELVVKEFNLDTVILVAVVLSRSVVLENYESLLAQSLGQLEQTVARLAEDGRIPRREKELTKKVGLALLIEHELAYDLAVFDDPEIIWERGERIHQLYRDLKREFDLDDRMKVIQQKVSIISRWSTFVISRLEGHRAAMLEWIIIILILAEILLYLAGVV
jgi:required for meiotic nuclear division protein 1